MSIDADIIGPLSSLSQGANAALELRCSVRGIPPSLDVLNGAQVTSNFSSETTSPVFEPDWSGLLKPTT